MLITRPGRFSARQNYPPFFFFFFFFFSLTASLKKILARLCVGIVAVEVLFAYPLGYDFVLNSIGPSTEYLAPWLPTAKMVDGKPTVYIGDNFYVRRTNCSPRAQRQLPS